MCDFLCGYLCVFVCAFTSVKSNRSEGTTGAECPCLNVLFWLVRRKCEGPGTRRYVPISRTVLYLKGFLVLGVSGLTVLLMGCLPTRELVLGRVGSGAAHCRQRPPAVALRVETPFP